ncbi:tRNA (5-methylaminomethyl-2-thiouridylate)-methyltransferase [Sulfobacillus acidophilus DSM 10332]|uniref:tRNA-specific 2-thiouridylase MnmA n=1 Tax=Sulfobacillus acidophilus (strain ATCC 700253 / DSM 10332 / NAL) TaxID=679936 RepID=G8TY89_SULAD|nr:tRNA (5-methylaminomethyl-2-thiouridylate)-methyltransferase [Sulfobacillus acidophilus DSM 10332]
MSKIVVVGLSGGVDSSAAALLLLEAGYDVIGVTMRHLPAETTNSCCGLEAIVDARRVAKALGIPHYLVDVEASFFERVIQPFETGYLAGQTPNPCALCNRFIKFGAMWDWAKSQGADYLATGHYVRVTYEAGRYRLWRAVDRQKDQSYLLYTLGQADLQHLLFPLGTLTKDQSRALAEQHGLVTAHKPDSQELCFVPNNDYHAYLREHRPEAERPGEIVDTEGRVLGEHQGVAFYTIGQRRGLGLALDEPRYVVRLDAKANRVVVGRRPQVERESLSLRDVHYVSDEPWTEAGRGLVKIRYNMEPAPATWEPQEASAVVRFDSPQWAVTPGQIGVLYQGEELIAGGKIAASD